MFQKLLLLALATVSTVLAAPTSAPPAITDTDVLQYALTLEHLENAFYSGALAKYDAGDFEKAGYPSWVRARFAQIAKHEEDHVDFLRRTLGSSATQPCEYNFPYTDPRSFAALSMMLEGVGGSAYLGAAKFVSDKDYLTAAASILAVESRHSAWVSSAVMKVQPWSGPFDTPITTSGAYSLAAQFITSCPSTNPALPVEPFPALSLSEAAPAHGAKVTVAIGGSNKIEGQTYVAWLNGLTVEYTELAEDGSTTVPEGLAGTAYAVAVSSKDQTPSDATMRSGFAIVQFPFGSESA
ncbi:ferritin-like domain-containing protein [Daedaleopsis nitida]|nr:ferritin-like domain-containing protein [Daedaleopsis nitida]